MNGVKANIELFDFWSPRENVTVWRRGIILYHAINGGPDLGPALVDLLEQARITLKKPNGRFWWHSMAIGRSFILASAGGRNKMPRFYPASKLVPADYLWRIYLQEDAQFNLECYKVSYTRRSLEYMSIVDWRRAAKSQ